ncbi:hypothetical protein KAR52_02010 [Candidatus Pacearchaeota archaeon]|nr:hypothetical protein [Candidatus Pacearchaeota archaeon]
MKKLLLIVLVGVFLMAGVIATVITSTFNSPADGHITEDNFKLLNITVYNNDTSQSMDLKIYGSNNSVVGNNSVIYRRSNVTNGTEITFNWTSPKLKTSDDPSIVLLMYFDNQTAEGNWSEIPVDNNMVLYFKFNNDSSVEENYANLEDDVVYDYSNAKKNGTNEGDTATWNSTGGRFGGAFDFGGEDNEYIAVADNSANDPLDITDEITIEFWLNPDSFGAGEDILFKDSSYHVQLGTTSPFDSIRWGVNVNGSFRYLTTSTGTLESGAFQHVAVTYNASNKVQRIYVQGREITSTTLSGLSDYNISTNNNDLFIGSDNSVPHSDTFDGRMDQVIIYNRTLNADDIREHANTKVTDETGVNSGARFKYDENPFNYSGKLGPALEFDGVDDTVTIPDNDSLDLNQSFSISFWAYPTDLTKNQTFLAKGSGTTTNYFIDYKTTSEIEFGFYNGAWRSVAVDASTFTANQWNLITATRNSSSNISTVYINGIEKGNLQLDYAPLANSHALKLGSFAGYNQNYTGLIDELIIYNKSLNGTEVTNIYQLKIDTWYWKFSVEDNDNLNMSSTRNFEIGTVWDVSPTDLGSVGAALNVNVSVGTLTINNTHASRNITINITSDYSGNVYFNETLPLNLSGIGGNYTRIQINVTSPTTEGSTIINFNITATNYSGENSVPYSRIVPVTLVTTSANPFLITNFETYPTIISQNNSGISLKASAINRGQGIAGSVSMTFELPTGWTNASGALTQNLGVIQVDEQKNASITVDIASNATSGVVTLYANISGQNSTGQELNLSYLTIGDINVTVNAISVGVGPSVIVEEVVVSRGGGGTASGGAESAVFDKGIEIVRGADDVSFDIDITNIHKNKILQDLTLKLTGFLEQYISISPSKISSINYNETKSFTVTLKAPSYKSYEEHTLKAVIDGYLVTGTIKRSYKETQNIKLIIQEVSREESNLSLLEAEKAVEEMQNAKFNIDEASKLLEQAKSKLSENKNKEAQILSKKIISLRDKAFNTDDLISKILKALKNPRKMGLLTGNVAKEIVDESGEIVSVNSIITGKAIFNGKSAKEILQMAIAAFKRGDYDTAQERARSAQILLILERKGNFGLFLFLYWPFIILGFIIFSFTGIIGYRRYQKLSISKKIENMNKQEENIRKLMRDSQESYFKGKISKKEHQRVMDQHQDKLAKLKKTRLSLRNKRIRVLKQQQIFQDLGMEKMQVESVIKKLQENFYRDRKIPENDYKTQFQILNKRLAEIEGERITLELLKEDGPEKVNVKETKQQAKKEIVKKEKEGKRKEIIIKIKEKILEMFNKLKEKISLVKNYKKEKQNIKTKKISEIKEMPKPVKKSENLSPRDFKDWFNSSISKIKEKSRDNFFFRNISGLPKKIIKKVRKDDKRGVILIDNKILNVLKKEASKMDCKGKWIKLNFKPKEEKNED